MNLSKNSCSIKIASTSLMVMAAMMVLSCDSNKDDTTRKLLPLFLLSSPKLILFNAGTHDGNLKGAAADARTGADGICNASANKPADATNVHAFISISTTDQIKDMPANYGYSTNHAVYGPDGTSLIWHNWADMLDGSTHSSLFSVGVLLSTKNWFSGSDQTGAFNSGINECNGFINNNIANSYQTGNSNSGIGNWISAGTATCDVTTSYVLCICEK